jgi:hypothetical protein
MVCAAVFVVFAAIAIGLIYEIHGPKKIKKPK